MLDKRLEKIQQEVAELKEHEKGEPLPEWFDTIKAHFTEQEKDVWRHCFLTILCLPTDTIP